MTISDFEEKLKNHVPTLQGSKGSYAVLVPLIERSGELSLLYEVRSAKLKRQPGEVCFPGGRMEPGESPVECALRETWEELGISREKIKIIAPLDYVYHRAGFLLYPILGQVMEEALDQLTPNPAEVAQTFLVSVEFLQSHPPKIYSYSTAPQVGSDFPYARIGFPNGYRWLAGVEEVPVYENQGPAIWGITGRITRGLIELVTGEKSGQ